jgi:hypothetical protein
MAQLHCYVPDEIAEQFKKKAEHAHTSTSKYLAMLIKNEIGSTWPDNYFELFGSWEGVPLERPEQGEYEQRQELK